MALNTLQKNKYDFIHWGYTFTILADKAHETAIKEIWECLTSNANIYYHRPMLPENIEKISYKQNILTKTKSSIIVEMQITKDNLSYITAIFTFVKFKKQN